MNCSICKDVECEDHFFREFVIDDGVGLVPECATSEASVQWVFQLGQVFFSIRAPVPFFPSIGEIAALDGMFGPGGDHGGFGDGDTCVGGEVLTVFLFTSVN